MSIARRSDTSKNASPDVTNTPDDSGFHWLMGGGEMGARMREMDWSKTALGPINEWPQSLKTAVGMLLNSPVAIVMLWGPEGVMIYNDAYSVFAGGRHPQLLGSPVLEGWPEVADFNRHVMDVCLGGGTLSFRDQHLVLHRHDVPEDVWMDLSYGPIRDESGAAGGVLAIVIETTERVLAERQVRQLNSTLEQQVHTLAELDRAKTSFFNNISHEFRTPLTLMLGPTEDALASPGRKLSDENLETVYRNELRLLKLVNALLDFSRIEAGQTQPRYQPTDLSQTTTTLASMFRSAVERAGLRYILSCDPLSEPVYVDREMWETIVLNLLSNALKFTFDGTIEVSLRDGEQQVQLSVRDTGIGIGSEDISRLFERFHRVEGARARTQEGSGIGLALVNDLVRLHGGAVDVTSEPGEGTTFTVTLKKGKSHLPEEAIAGSEVLPSSPVRMKAFVEEALRWLPSDESARTRSSPPSPLAASGSAAATPPTVPGTVLLAEDNQDMREYVTRLLSAHWDVHAVSDGAAALAASQHDVPDVVVTDVMMPGLDGFSLLRALRADPRTADVPVIMLSARAGEEARVEGLQRGADDYLVKPFSGRELIARVNAQVTLARNARERAQLLEREQMARREAELQKQHLFSLFMQAPMPITVLRGPDFIIELANPMACRVWGRTHDDVINRPLFEALPEIRNQIFNDLLESVFRTGIPYVGSELPAKLDRRRDGAFDTAYFTFLYTPLKGVHGNVEGVLVVAGDVTDQVTARQEVQRAQDRLTFALDSAGVGYWDLDLVTHAAVRSPSYNRILGHASPPDHWTWEMFLDHVDAEDRVRVSESFERASTTGEDWHFECRINRVDGVHRWITGYGRCEPSPEGRPARMLGVVLDVTERRELLNRERDARFEADRANRAKDEFLAMLGHELRNPLAPIHTALQLMRLRGDGTAERERTVIQRQVNHLTRLVDDLLDVSRIARGKVELKRERVEIAAIVTKAIETVSPLLEQRTLVLDVDVPRLGLTIDGDPVRLAQVVSNLLTNAAKYTEPGGRISVRAERDKHEIVLRVRDTGIGISADILPSLFDLFVQGRQALDRSQGGLGIGLTVVRSLVALHGGTVSAHSDGAGQGSEFLVRLPAAAARPVSAPSEVAMPNLAPQPTTGLRVLVVDDNSDAAEMLADALALRGHEPRIAHDGPTALRVAEEFKPAIAVLDIGLPVMDGYELAERLRRIQGLEDVKLIAVTGYGQEADRQQSRSAGFAHHFVKPVDFEALERIVGS